MCGEVPGMHVVEIGRGTAGVKVIALVPRISGRRIPKNFGSCVMNNEGDLVKTGPIKRSMTAILARNCSVNDQVVAFSDRSGHSFDLVLRPAVVCCKPEAVKRICLQELLGGANSLILKLQSYGPQNSNLVAIKPWTTEDYF